jgi:DNA recombination protein RmuC
MDLMSLLIIVIVIFAGFALLYKFFKDDLNALRESVNATKDTVSSSLSASTKDIHDRLLHATEVMGEIKREAGVFAETSRSMKELQDYLRSPKLRGNIGEMVLKDLVSQMFPKSSYATQHRFKSGDKVDLVIKTDAGLLPVDSKFPMENFQKLVGTTNKDERASFRKAFIRDIKLHVGAISQKYILPQEGTLDFALMYISSESVYYEVAGEDVLMEFARAARVYPVSPNTLYAALQTILLSFEGKRIEARAAEVFTLLRAIQKDYDKSTSSLATLGNHLKSAYNKYSEVQSGFNSLGQKLVSTKKLTGNTGSSKLIEE